MGDALISMTNTTLLLQVVLIPALAPLFVGVIRKMKAIMQNRHGASIVQPYRELRKLFTKEEIVSEDCSFIFLIAPFIVFAVTLVLGAMVPLFGLPAPLAGHGDLLTFISLVALAAFFLALSGLDAGGAFGGMGSSREMTIASMTEAGVLFSFLPVAFLAASADLSLMAERTGEFTGSGLVALLIALGGFFIALLAENARYPFDNPSTHLELTMVHEAMILEYSGRRLALMEWAAASKLFLFAIVGVQLFIPWMPAWAATAPLIALVAGLKIGLLAFAIAFVESTIAKLRYFRLPDLLLSSFMLGVIALILAAF